MSGNAGRGMDGDSKLKTESKAWLAFLGAGRFHITAIAALGVFTFGWLFTGRYQWLLTLVCALDWFIVNLTNRVWMSRRFGQPHRGHGFVARHGGDCWPPCCPPWWFP